MQFSLRAEDEGGGLDEEATKKQREVACTGLYTSIGASDISSAGPAVAFTVVDRLIDSTSWNAHFQVLYSYHPIVPVTTKIY